MNFAVGFLCHNNKSTLLLQILEKMIKMHLFSSHDHLDHFYLSNKFKLTKRHICLKFMIKINKKAIDRAIFSFSLG